MNRNRFTATLIGGNLGIRIIMFSLML